MANIGVQGAVEDALLGDLAGEPEVVDALLAEQVLQRGGVEEAVAGLDHQGGVVVGDDRLDEVGARPVPGGVDQLLARGGPVAIVVVDVDDPDALVEGARDQVADPGHHGLDAGVSCSASSCS
jgi:hypothetical protein